MVVDGDGAGDMVNAVASIDADATLAIVVWNGTVDVTKSGGDPRLDRDVELIVTDLAGPRLPRPPPPPRRGSLQPQRRVGRESPTADRGRTKPDGEH